MLGTEGSLETGAEEGRGGYSRGSTDSSLREKAVGW